MGEGSSVDVGKYKLWIYMILNGSNIDSAEYKCTDLFIVWPRVNLLFLQCILNYFYIFILMFSSILSHDFCIFHCHLVN